MLEPPDAESRRAIEPVICYPSELLAPPDLDAYRAAFANYRKTDEVRVPPRDAATFRVPRGGVFRISSIEGPQVGDLNLWNADDVGERFYSGKTRALHGTHVSVGDRLWSNLPQLRPMATIIEDTLAWYGADEFGGRVHDVIGTRCDPYTGRLLSGDDYHHCCHSNLTRALADALGISLDESEPYVHDVMNVFMCTGFSREKGAYFMKASPVRPGDHIDFLAEIDLLGALSACPGGDCSATHSSDEAACFPLLVEVFEGDPPEGWHSADRNAYDRSHGR
ncbi:MAG: DUF1989 domain-containing protein [Boseongicola sp. SB0662_bin_57]|nr:DUF1989 domain-containing protein [Boseongicola sp. SB0662_bin_57]